MKAAPSVHEESEIWKPVIGWEGLYEVSSRGHVRNATNKRVLRTHASKNGYVIVRLYARPRIETHFVHRLVGKSFVAGYKEGLDINHKNGRRSDNAHSNLEWCSRGENIRHAYRVLGIKPRNSTKRYAATFIGAKQ